MRFIFLAVPALTVAACATPSDRISDALVGYGLAPDQARCVGDRLQSRLSLAQLQDLARLARAYREQDPNPSQLNAGDLIRVASQVQDIRVPIEVGKAAAGCGIVPNTTLGLLSAVTGG
ncbi:hypothetical protein M8312_02720 [Sphingomonas sp. KRR8]|jgi:hypothetical protein|uniref:hypothetical protein n=1 Tax=Sphingomonas sp. KRR8 TaxID=2942996 RepID=UPI002020127C|nr:hypothetical protein [Sphingomonas sp. KRR8]URD61446.1 hypothetical protein M8312_02720 [Sphingomonas sp. KRR8]